VSYMMNFIEFLYNNTLTVTIVMAATLLFVVVFRRVYIEYQWNKKLFKKKTLLRNIERFKFKNRSKKMVTVTLPIILLSLYAGSHYINTPVYDNHTMRLDNEQAVSDIYQNFNSKFYSAPISNDQSPTVMSVNRLAGAEPQVKVNNIDFVSSANNDIYVVNQYGLDIYQLLTDEVDHFDTIAFDFFDNTCFSAYQPEGVMVYEDKVIVVHTYMSDHCSEDVTALHHRKHLTTINVYENNQDFPLVDTYEVTGLLNGLYFDETGYIHLSVKQYIPFEEPQVDIKQYIPSISNNDSLLKSSLSDIHYIEGVNPSSFSSVVGINLHNGNKSIETVLTDFNHVIRLAENKAILTADSFEFVTASAMFEMKDPIQNANAAITLFNINEGQVNLGKTVIQRGQLQKVETINQGKELYVLSEDTLNYQLTHYSNQLDVIRTHTIEAFEMDTVINHDQNIYLIPKDPSQAVKVFHLGLTFDAYQLNRDQMYRYMYPLSSTRALGVNIIDHRFLQIHLLNNTNPNAMTVLDQLFIDYIYLDSNRLEELMMVEDGVLMSLTNVRPEGVGVLGSSNRFELKMYDMVDYFDLIGTMQIDGSGNYPFTNRLIMIDNHLISVTPSSSRVITKIID